MPLSEKPAQRPTQAPAANTSRSRLLWALGALLIALPIAVPIIAILLTFLAPASEVWQHLRDTVLVEYVINTFLLLGLVGCISLSIGVTCAWLTATRQFPGQRLFRWALILPFAAPAYVIAYAYADILAFSGPVQTWLRDVAELSMVTNSALPSIRSLPGAAVVLGLVLYPYIYLLAYTAFADQARPLAEAARSLGASSSRTFFVIALPHARPAIAGGLALALMETAADFGVVEFYGVPTLTNGIFRTWYAQGEQLAALQLAGWLFVIVALLVVFEQLARRGSHANPVARNVGADLVRIRGWRAWLATVACAMPLLLGFVVPVAYLALQAIEVGDPLLGEAFGGFVFNSVSVAGITASIAVALAIWLAYANRQISPTSLTGRTTRLGVRTATLGYALPGMVLAVGLIGPLTALDRTLARAMRDHFDWSVGLFLTGSVAALVFVYLARFLTVAFNSAEGGLARIHPRFDAAARSLGSSPVGVLKRIHWPLLLPTLLTAGLLVFIDVIKELPATLILRPFNFETLATRAYRLASDERLAEASTAALCIVAVGLIPTLLLAAQSFRRRV